jgi:hypothetical protein
MDTPALRELFHDALFILSSVDEFKTNMNKTNDDEIKYAFHILFKKHCEKLQKKVNEIADFMNCNNHRQ